MVIFVEWGWGAYVCIRERGAEGRRGDGEQGTHLQRCHVASLSVHKSQPWRAAAG